MNPVFSIIIPVYNVAPYLEATLDSVFAAVDKIGWEQAEIICIDDGSTDDSPSILAHHASRLRLLHQQNAGVSAARNAGIAVATGDWLWFVDADDRIHPDSLVCFRDRFVRRYPDADYLMFDYTHEASVFARALTDEEPVAFNSADPEMATQVFREVCRVLFRRDRIADQRFLAYRIGEDVAFSLTYRAAHRSGYYLPVCAYYYLRREGSATCTPMLSPEKCADWVSANHIIVEKMSEILGPHRLVWWYPMTIFKGYNGCPYALPLSEQRMFFRDYVSLLKKIDAIVPYAWHRRFVVGLLNLMPSPVLGRMFYWLYRMRHLAGVENNPRR